MISSTCFTRTNFLILLLDSSWDLPSEIKIAFLIPRLGKNCFSFIFIPSLSIMCLFLDFEFEGLQLFLTTISTDECRDDWFYKVNLTRFSSSKNWFSFFSIRVEFRKPFSFRVVWKELDILSPLSWVLPSSDAFHRFLTLPVLLAILWSHLLRLYILFPYISCLLQMKICHNLGV